MAKKRAHRPEPEPSNAKNKSASKATVGREREALKPARKKQKIEDTASVKSNGEVLSEDAPRLTRSASNKTSAKNTSTTSQKKESTKAQNKASKPASKKPSKAAAEQEPAQPKVSISSVPQKRKAKAKSKKDENVEESEDEAGSDGHQFWLMKAEPESRIEKGKDVKFSIDDLKASSSPEPWDGVRNLEGTFMSKFVFSTMFDSSILQNESHFQIRCINKRIARNNMRAMTKGDLAFFYHSNCKVPGIVGIMEIVEEHSVDGTCLSR